MITHDRELLIYYNPTSTSDRKTIAHAQSIVPFVRSYSFAKAPSTQTSWKQIMESLELHPKEILNKADPYYQKHIRGRDFDTECWLKVIQKNPFLIKAPIAIRGKKAILCTNTTDIYRLYTSTEKN